MALFGRKSRKEINAEWDRKFRDAVGQSTARISSLESKLKSTTAISQAITNLNTKMQSSRSMSDELYDTPYKSGPFAGASYSTNAHLRRLSRIAQWQSNPAQELNRRFSDLVVGHGLRLEASPVWRITDPNNSIPATSRSEWSKNTEARYNLWCKSKEIDEHKQFNAYQMEQQNYDDLLKDGEYFEIYRYRQTTRGNPLSIQRVNADDIRTPNGSVVSGDNTEYDGIEYNSKDQPVAYHVYNYDTYKTIRVPRIGTRSGRVFVNHVKLGDKRRGIPLLADSIQQLTKLGDWSALELQAAIVNALFAVWVSPPEDEDGQSTIGGGVSRKNDPTSTNITDEFWQENDNISYDKGGVVLDKLPAGHKVESFDTKRPNLNFGVFYDQIKQDLAGSKGMSLSVMNLKMEGSYSSARGELLLVWNTIMKMRSNQAWSGNGIRYKMWLWGEVVRGTVPALSWNESDEMRDAWSSADWVGSQRPDIDPLRSVKAAVEDHNRGYKTGQMIAAERGGGDYDENLTKVGEELSRVAENIKPFADLGDSVEVDMVE